MCNSKLINLYRQHKCCYTPGISNYICATSTAYSLYIGGRETYDNTVMAHSVSYHQSGTDGNEFLLRIVLRVSCPKLRRRSRYLLSRWVTRITEVAVNIFCPEGSPEQSRLGSLLMWFVIKVSNNDRNDKICTLLVLVCRVQTTFITYVYLWIK